MATTYFDKEKIPLEEISPTLAEDLRHQSRGEDFHPGRRGSCPRQRDPHAGSNPLVGLHQDFVRNQEPGRRGRPGPAAKVRHMARTASLSTTAEMAGLGSFRRRAGASLSPPSRLLRINPTEAHRGSCRKFRKPWSRCRSNSNRNRRSPRRRRRKNRRRRRRRRRSRSKSRSLWRKSRLRRPSGRLRHKPVAPIARPSTAGPTGPAPSGKAAMIFKPRIQYPYEARRSKITGSGTSSSRLARMAA